MNDVTMASCPKNVHLCYRGEYLLLLSNTGNNIVGRFTHICNICSNTCNMSNGEKDLDTLLRSMQPELQAGEYVFCTSPDPQFPDEAGIICRFREKEGLTLVMEKGLADRRGLSYSFVASWITLTVHSSLEAVGLTAAFAKALSAAQISCNVVAAFYHDHIFVGVHDTEKAMQVLHRLSQDPSASTP